MLAVDLNVLYALSVGMLATVNPCGFVMLPTYLTYFLGSEGKRAGSTRSSVLRALVVSGAVTAGFFAVFLAIGLVTQLGSRWIQEEASGWLSIGAGVLLVVMGLGSLFGFKIPFFSPRVELGGKDRSLTSMFLYGVTYAVASIGCTIGPFIGVLLGQTGNTGGATGIAGFFARVVTVGSYGLGMGLVLCALTVSLALASKRLLGALRKVMARIDLVSGAILVLAGIYFVLYGWVALDPINRRNPVVDAVETVQPKVANWINNQRGPLGLVLGALVVGAIAWVVFRKDRTPEADLSS